MPASPLESLQAAWRADGSLRALAGDGKLWLAGDVAPSTALPYVAAMEVSDTADDRSTGTAATRRATLQISAHDATAAGAKAIGLAIAAALDRAPAKLGDLDGAASWSLQNAECNSGLLTLGEGLAPGGRDCHVQTVDLELFYTRS